MSRYIDADLSDEDIAQKVQEQTADGDTFITVRRILNSFPTADVAPVRHAHWIIEETGEYRYRCSCSSCLNGYEVDKWRDPIDLTETDWCLWCGAIMDEEIKE